MKPVRLSEHALSYIASRGFTVEQVEETIRTESWTVTEQGRNRKQCSKEFEFDDVWNGKYYRKKQVRPIFVEESAEIVVITVYTYYY